MKIADILKLMKAGYTAGEISGLDRKDDILELIQGGVEKDDIPDYLALLDEAPEDPDRDEPDKGPEEPKPEEPDTPPAEDYKKLYEELKAKTEKAAARKDISGQQKTKTADEILAELAVDYM